MPMTNDVREAAAKIREAMRLGCVVALPGEMERNERLLAQHFAMLLDPSPVTPEALAAEGFEQDIGGWERAICTDCRIVVMFDDEGASVAISDDDAMEDLPLPHVRSMGQLRALLFALEAKDET